jgi:hypothetical protein
VESFGKPSAGWRLRLYTVIFEADTRAGRLFDQCLIVVILVSVAAVVIDSVQGLGDDYSSAFSAMEWLFTIAFTLEYLARLACVHYPLRYARSFFGVIDLLALLPTYIALLAPEMHALIDVRVLRLLRVFRVFKLTAYVVEYQSLGRELVASQRKILIFPVCRADDCSGDGDRDVCGRRPGQRVHQHSYFGVLGHYHHDHSRLWRYHPQNGLGAPDCIDDDAIGLGNAGGAHGHCHS